MTIKIVPYEDRKKYCTEFNPSWSSLSDDEIKLHIIQIAAKETENYNDLRQLINILDTFDVEKYKNNQTAIQFGKMNFESWAV